MGSLCSLSKLYLNDNRLTALPVELGSLEQLLCLYLENNHLQELPSSLLALGVNRVGRSSFHVSLSNNPLRGHRVISESNSSWRDFRSPIALGTALALEINGHALLGQDLAQMHVPIPCPTLLELAAATLAATKLNRRASDHAIDLKG